MLMHTTVFVDDETTAYIVENRRYFEDLRQVSGQLAGLMVLAAAGGKSAAPDHPLLAAASQLQVEAAGALRGARVSRGAAEHHHHLLYAAGALEVALAMAHRFLPLRGDCEADLVAILHPLRVAHGHLQKAANALPGFTMVDFEQGCCGGASKDGKHKSEVLIQA
jgi:hypothetical protein